jgi:hypothetical protein
MVMRNAYTHHSPATRDEEAIALAPLIAMCPPT